MHQVRPRNILPFADGRRRDTFSLQTPHCGIETALRFTFCFLWNSIYFEMKLMRSYTNSTHCFGLDHTTECAILLKNNLLGIIDCIAFVFRIVRVELIGSVVLSLLECIWCRVRYVWCMLTLGLFYLFVKMRRRKNNKINQMTIQYPKLKINLLKIQWSATDFYFFLRLLRPSFLTLTS